MNLLRMCNSFFADIGRNRTDNFTIGDVDNTRIMEVLYQEAIKLLLETQRQVQQLSSFSTGNQLALESRVQEGLQQLELDYERLRTLVRKEPVETRQLHKNRVDQFEIDLRNLKSSVSAYQRHRTEAEQAVRAREELFSREYTMNNSRQTAIPLDPSLQHNTQLQEANRNLDGILANAADVFKNLQDQHSILKGARKKMWDIANTLGLSNTIMRLIERRTTQDRYIFWGGVIVTLIIIYLALRYLI